MSQTFPVRGDAPGSRTLTVFLSHSFVNSGLAGLVQRHMETLSVEVYLAEHDLRPGTHLVERIIREIKHADVTFVLLTNESADSAWVHQEIGAAKASGKLVIPLVAKGVNPARLGMLGEFEWLPLDLANPTATLISISASVQPLIDERRRLSEQQAAKYREVQAKKRREAQDRVLGLAVLAVLGLIIVGIGSSG